MPLLRHAKKALRSSLKKAEVNQKVKSRTKTMMDAMRREPNDKNLTASYRAIDKAVKSNVFHANKAARLKSQMASLLK